MDTHADLILCAFLDQYCLDAEAGGPRPLAEYLSRYAGHEELIAREYFALREAEGRASDAPPDEDRIGPFRLLREIGRGGQAVVWMAEDTRLDRRVALKILRGMDVETDQAVARFRREARAAAELDDPGICAVYEVGFDEVPWIAMRLVEGVTLADLLAEGPGGLDALQLPRAKGIFPSGRSASHADGAEAEARTAGTDADEAPSRRPNRMPVGLAPDIILPLFEQLARSLHVAHEAGVIHRDIKPGNIKITPEGRPVILDFGVAHLTEEAGLDLTMTGQQVGTPIYMAPEQVRGETVDARTDVYALGVTLYELLSGRRPFARSTVDSTYRAVLEDDAPRLQTSRVRRQVDLEVLVGTAMAKDRDRRYASAQLFAEDVRRLIQGQPILARRATRRERFVSWCRRNPRAAMLSGFLLLTSSGTAWGLWQTTQAKDALEEAIGQKDKALIEREEQRLIAVDAQRDAESELQRAEEVKGVLVEDLFGAAGEAVKAGLDLELLEVMAAETGERLSAGSIEDARTRAELHQMLARIQLLLRDPEAALAHCDAIDALGETNLQRSVLIDAANDRATALIGTSRHEEARAVARANLGRIRAITSTLTLQEIQARQRIASALFGQGNRAQEALEHADELLADLHAAPEFALRYQVPSLEVRAGALLQLRRTSEALVASRKAAEVSAEVHGAKHGASVLMRRRLANLLARIGRADEALEILEKDVGVMKETSGWVHPRTREARLSLALVSAGRRPAEEVIDQVEALLRDSPDWAANSGPRLEALYVLATSLSNAGQLDRSLEVSREALAGHAEGFGLGAHGALSIYLIMSITYTRKKEFREAARIAGEGAGEASKTVGPLNRLALLLGARRIEALFLAGETGEVMAEGPELLSRMLQRLAPRQRDTYQVTRRIMEASSIEQVPSGLEEVFGSYVKARIPLHERGELSVRDSSDLAVLLLAPPVASLRDPDRAAEIMLAAAKRMEDDRMLNDILQVSRELKGMGKDAAALALARRAFELVDEDDKRKEPLAEMVQAYGGD